MAHQAKVDMMDAARAAQRTETERFLRPGGLRLVAPAKVNLFLGIGARRPDGYHDALSIMHALALHDVVWMRAEPAVSLEVEVTMRAAQGLPPIEVSSEDNLVSHALRALAREVGRTEPERIVVHVEKNIPAQAGLGGGSSDAAAALVGACGLWGLRRDDPRVVRVARSLGADVAFFLYGGCAALSGVGDEFHHALEPMRTAATLIKPSEGVSTAAAYRLFDEAPDYVPEQRWDRAFAAKRADEVPLTNNLVGAAERLLPELADIRRWAEGQPGVEAALMSGSGSATFACCESFDAATKLATAARAQGWWSRATTFSPLAASSAPLRR